MLLSYHDGARLTRFLILLLWLTIICGNAVYGNLNSTLDLSVDRGRALLINDTERSLTDEIDLDNETTTQVTSVVSTTPQPKKELLIGYIGASFLIRPQVNLSLLSVSDRLAY